ncbi:MAG: TIGR02450 family Trp-rich protein [Cyanobacteria bacterium P01_A01_bin.135]
MAQMRYPHLVGSKWTAQQQLWGWRHFQVVNRKNQGRFVFAEMVATCDSSVRFWVNAKALKDRDLWLAGWQQLPASEPLSEPPN